ncbi:MAG: NADH-quinone oxidoreductase subunit NuoK [Proteobacteria bacterium]|nr:NADH-quinone oxidoreductase subunit NuoK [Pseudomonadota bacterium]
MLDITLNHFFVLSLVLFIIGIMGVAFNRKSFIHILFSLEIIFIASNINFVAGSTFFNKIDAQVFSLIALGIMAVELAIGLSLAYLLFKKHKSIEIEKI